MIMDARVCKNCGIEQLLSKFRPSKKKMADGSVKTYRSYGCLNCEYGELKRKRGLKPKKINLFQINDEWFKICSKCNATKPVDLFAKDRNVCRACKGRQSVIHRRNLPSEIRKELHRKAYRREAEQKLRQKYRQEKRYSYRRKTKEYRQKYKHTFEKHILAYNAKKKGATVGVKFSRQDIIKRDGLNCYLCGKLLTNETATVEHLIPISRGGAHKLENVKLACRPCNSSKNKKTITEFKKYRGDYDYLKQSKAVNFNDCQPTQFLDIC